MPVGARGRRGPAESLGQLLPRMLDDLGLDAASESVRIMGAWDEAVGPELATHCRPEGLRRDEVVALVRDSAWMQRVQLESPGILERLRTLSGTSKLLRLRLRIGPVDPG